VRDYVKKGAKLFVEGRLTTRSWAQTKTGEPHKWPLLEETGETKEERRSCLKGVNCDGESH
jgi:single-stranded DNA-binding protein